MDHILRSHTLPYVDNARTYRPAIGSPQPACPESDDRAHRVVRRGEVDRCILCRHEWPLGAIEADIATDHGSGFEPAPEPTPPPVCEDCGAPESSAAHYSACIGDTEERLGALDEHVCTEPNALQETVAALLALARPHPDQFAYLLRVEEQETAKL